MATNHRPVFTLQPFLVVTLIGNGSTSVRSGDGTHGYGYFSNTTILDLTSASDALVTKVTVTNAAPEASTNSPNMIMLLVWDNIAGYFALYDEKPMLSRTPGSMQPGAQVLFEPEGGLVVPNNSKLGMMIKTWNNTNDNMMVVVEGGYYAI